MTKASKTRGPLLVPNPKARLFDQVREAMRLLECLRLRVKDVDFARGQIVVREGKGDKDRVTMLPERLKGELQAHLHRVKLLHDKDLREGLGVRSPLDG